MTYDVYFDTSDPPTTLICDDVSSTTCDPGTLSYNTHYYWKVVATGLNGPSPGQVWDFWTGDVVISEVRVTNVRDTAFNVSWVTNQSATGEVHYGTDPDNLDQIAYDDRGAGTRDDTHYVTLLGLTSNTTYYFDVISDGTTDDNGGVHYTVTTGPTLGLPASDTIYGQVFKEDGTTPAEGTIVYITLRDADGSGSSGEAAPLSALVDSNGYWYGNLGNARMTDLSDYFYYSASGDEVELRAQGASDGTASQTVDTANDRLAPDMMLGSSHFCDSVSEIPQEECEAMVALYENTDGANWSNNSGWLDTSTPCNWYGVTCSAGHVTRLNLYDNQLRGSIPPELGDLTNLTLLFLHHNQLSGSIPPELGNLANLQSLYLSSNQLSGNIPVQLGGLGNLQVLHLGYNQLSSSIPPGLGDLANLQNLFLQENQLSDSIPPKLGDLSNLTSLLLGGNQLSDGIPPELGSLTDLRTLSLGSNQLSGSIPPELGNLTNLRGLYLYNNQLSGSIPSQLGSLANLTQLSLDNNQLSDSIPPELGNLSNLTDLYLYNNQLSGNIPVQLGNLINLDILSLYNNQLSGDIPPELGNLTDLRGLYLHNNSQLSGALPHSLTNLTKLDGFYFYNTDLCEPDDAEFQAWLASISNLQSTGVTCCVLFGDLDGDGDVDVEDIMLVANCWRMTDEDPGCAPYDLDGDGIITVVDIMLVVKHWGESCVDEDCVPDWTLDCGDSDSWNNGNPGSTDHIDTYSCTGWDESGPEYAYEFTPSASNQVAVSLNNLSADLDLFVLAPECNATDCLVHDDLIASFDAAAGQTYYIVVDGYEGAVGDYTISVDCLDGGCVPDWTLDCGGGDSWNNGYTGSTDLIDIYSCTGWDESGPEYAYAFVPSVSGQVDVSLSDLSTDLDLFIVAPGCNPTNCLAYGDATASFNVVAGQLYYVVVDGYQGAVGDYTISVSCPVGAQNQGDRGPGKSPQRFNLVPTLVPGVAAPHPTASPLKH